MNNYRHSPAGPAQAPRAIAKTLKYKLDQEYLLRRLASALVLQWDELPDNLQDLIIDQAVLVEDREAGAVEARDIENFVRGAKVSALGKPAPRTD
ncbi:MAG: hypothetical protein JNK94_04220 [Hyphomonadaceae bacterium]|nr:hypothetical protein [Hyphomonadaceae bacterium]MBX3509683.1 hypothetical protein [Hyphomonadaceae bacterium]